MVHLMWKFRSAILNFENDDKFCFIWSILANYILFLIQKIGDSTGVSNYRQYFTELNIEGFGFTDGLKCNDVNKFENLNKLSINVFDLNFYPDQNTWKDKLIPIEVSKHDSDKKIDLLFYKNEYVLIKKLKVTLGNPNCNHVCRKCLSSYTFQNMLIKPKEKREQK